MASKLKTVYLNWPDTERFYGSMLIQASLTLNANKVILIAYCMKTGFLQVFSFISRTNLNVIATWQVICQQGWQMGASFVHLIAP